jgi:hypothetical protein
MVMRSVERGAERRGGALRLGGTCLTWMGLRLDLDGLRRFYSLAVRFPALANEA